MKKRATIGALAALLALGTLHNAGADRKVVQAAQNFHRYYQDLQGTGSLSPIERVVFSLVLSNSKTTDNARPVVLGRS